MKITIKATNFVMKVTDAKAHETIQRELMEKKGQHYIHNKCRNIEMGLSTDKNKASTKRKKRGKF